MKKRDPRRHKRLQRVLRNLEEVGPTYPSLRSRKYTQQSVPGVPDTYQSNVENNSPSAWRMWWHFDPEATGHQRIVVTEIGPHPSNYATY